MAQLTHSQKVKLARRMRSPNDIRFHVPIFSTKNWMNRRDGRMGVKKKTSMIDRLGLSAKRKKK